MDCLNEGNVVFQLLWEHLGKAEIFGHEVDKAVLWIEYKNQHFIFLGVSSGPAKKKKDKGFWWNGLFYQPRKSGAPIKNLKRNTNVTTGEKLRACSNANSKSLN